MIEVRPEQVSDAAAMAAILRAAFDGATEAELVARLRSGGELVLSLVAESDGELVGTVAFARRHETKALQDMVAAEGGVP